MWFSARTVPQSLYYAVRRSESSDRSVYGLSPSDSSRLQMPFQLISNSPNSSRIAYSESLTDKAESLCWKVYAVKFMNCLNERTGGLLDGLLMRGAFSKSRASSVHEQGMEAK